MLKPFATVIVVAVAANVKAEPVVVPICNELILIVVEEEVVIGKPSDIMTSVPAVGTTPVFHVAVLSQLPDATVHAPDTKVNAHDTAYTNNDKATSQTDDDGDGDAAADDDRRDESRKHVVRRRRRLRTSRSAICDCDDRSCCVYGSNGTVRARVIRSPPGSCPTCSDPPLYTTTIIRWVLAGTETLRLRAGGTACPLHTIHIHSDDA